MCHSSRHVVGAGRISRAVGAVDLLVRSSWGAAPCCMATGRWPSSKTDRKPGQSSAIWWCSQHFGLRPFIEKFARANGNPKPGNEGFRRSNWLISGLRNSDFEAGRSGHKPLASARQLCQALRVALIPSRRNIIPTAAALALLGFLPVRAGDWPSSARPNRDGVERNRPSEVLPR